MHAYIQEVFIDDFQRQIPGEVPTSIILLIAYQVALFYPTFYKLTFSLQLKMNNIKVNK